MRSCCAAAKRRPRDGARASQAGKKREAGGFVFKPLRTNLVKTLSKQAQL